VTINCNAHAYHYGDAQGAVKSSYNLCSGSGPLTAIAESKHPRKLKIPNVWQHSYVWAWAD